MKTGMEIRKNHLSHAMSACVENGQRLHEDAEWLGTDRSATALALCILAQEEFAKAFLLHLICEGIIPWTVKAQESLHNHRDKQVIGLIMEWLSPADDEFDDRIGRRLGDYALPPHVADAMKLYVEKVQPQGHISCPPAASDPRAKSVADGDRDKTKQDALYVRLSKAGEVISVPTQASPETVEVELAMTKRFSDLVRPLREGTIGLSIDYDLFREAMNFLLLDKRNRPFLILNESEFGGPVSSATGTTWPHSITVLIENISDEQATRVNGFATLFLDKKTVRPSFRFIEFAVDPRAANLCTFFVSEETHARGTSSSHMLNLYIDLKYHGVTSDRKYHACMWSTYDSHVGIFRETLTDSQDLVDVGSPSRGELELKWRHPTSI